jgi:uncharacterized protein HemY
MPKNMKMRLLTQENKDNMMDINNGYDRHLDPPDSDEAIFCEYCGQEMEYIVSDASFWCENQFCPEKWTNEIVHNMAEHLVEVEQELRDTQLKLKSTQNTLGYVRNTIAQVQMENNAHEVTIETLERLLNERLTQSQSNVVVRDTNYQITRMEDSLECLKECSDWDNFYEEFALVEKEWAEVKKILENG